MERSNSYFYEQLYKQAMAGDESAYEAMFEEVQADRALDVSAIRSGVKSLVGDAFKAGEIDGNTALGILRQYVKQTAGDAERQIAEWQYEIDTGRKYGELKDDYLNGVVTFDEAVEARVEYGLMDEGDADDAVLQWKYQLDTGTPYDDVKYMVIEGEMSQADAKKVLMEYGGKTSADAMESINGWIYMDETGADSFSRYSYVYDALSSGSKSTFEAAVKGAMADYGYTRDVVVSAARSQITSLVGSNEITADKAISLRKTLLGDTFTKNEEYFQLREYKYVAQNGSSTGYSKYDDFLESIPSGGRSMKKYAKELLDHGVDKSTAAGEITKAYKAQYLALKESDPDAAKKMLEWLYDAYEALGYTREYEYNHYIKYWK